MKRKRLALTDHVIENNDAVDDLAQKTKTAHLVLNATAWR
jgi:hypothetical protein